MWPCERVLTYRLRPVVLYISHDLSKHYQQLGTTCSNPWAYGRHFTFKRQKKTSMLFSFFRAVRAHRKRTHQLPGKPDGCHRKMKERNHLKSPSRCCLPHVPTLALKIQVLIFSMLMGNPGGDGSSCTTCRRQQRWTAEIDAWHPAAWCLRWRSHLSPALLPPSGKRGRILSKASKTDS